MKHWLWLLFILLVPNVAAAAPKTFNDCPGCPSMAALPGGSFTMGSPADEPGRAASETPHTVTVKAFAIGRYDVTVAQWKAFVRATHRPVATGCAWAGPAGPALDAGASWQKLDFVQDDDHPVVCVSWQDARDYAAWLSLRTGHDYRLPSEAEWEYAARAGTTTAYPWGAVADHDHANYGAEACCTGLASGADRWEKTAPVGSFPANAFGLYDMSGNVLQWLEDCLSDYATAPADGSAFTTGEPLKAGGPWPAKMAGLDTCAFRMLRGGDWGDPPSMLRSAFRNYAPPKGMTIDTYRSAGAGFRVAREVK